MIYKLYKTTLGNEVNVMRFNDDGSITSFSQNLDSTDYHAYLKWLAEGNEPLPPDEV
jgi:hypothetical protein